MLTRSPFKLFASGIFVSFLAFNCTVTTGEDDDDDDTVCAAGDTQECVCSDGTSGTRKCTTAGTGYGNCVCGSAGASGGGGVSGGGVSGGGGASASGGTAGSEAGAGGVLAQAGAGGDSGEAGAGGTSAGAAGQGGSGGEGLECAPAQDADPCEVCVLDKCCAEFFACLDDDECAEQFDFMAECTDDQRVFMTATPADVEECADTLSEDTDDTWSTGLNSLLPPLLNCMAGDTNDSSWPSQSSWSASSCRDGCFAKF